MTILRRLWRRHETGTRIQLRRFVHVAVPWCAGATLAAAYHVEGVLQPLTRHWREGCAHGVPHGVLRRIRPSDGADRAAPRVEHGGDRATAHLDHPQPAARAHARGGGL